MPNRANEAGVSIKDNIFLGFYFFTHILQALKVARGK